MERAPANGCSANGAQAMNSASTTRMWTAGIPETSKEAAQSSPTAQATAAQSTRLCSSVPEWRAHLRLALQCRNQQSNASASTASLSIQNTAITYTRARKDCKDQGWVSGQKT